MSHIVANTRSAPRRSSRKSWTSAMRRADPSPIRLRVYWLHHADRRTWTHVHCAPMIVGIDGRSLARGQAQRGVGHYTASLTAALAGGFPGDAWRVLVPGPAGPVPPGVERVASRAPRRLAF